MCHGFMTHPFFSSDFTDESEAVLLIGLLTEFRRILAAGQWLAPDMCCYCFFVTQISQMTQIFLRGIIFVPQISQIYTDFSSWDYFCPTDFTDLHRFFFVGLFLSHRFHRFTQIFLRGIIFVPQISQIYTDFSSWDYFVPQISQIYTDFFESLVNRFVRSQGVSATTEQVASAKFRVIRWIKKSASSAKSA